MREAGHRCRASLPVGPCGGHRLCGSFAKLHSTQPNTWAQTMTETDPHQNTPNRKRADAHDGRHHPAQYSRLTGYVQRRARIPQRSRMKFFTPTSNAETNNSSPRNTSAPGPPPCPAARSPAPSAQSGESASRSPGGAILPENQQQPPSGKQKPRCPATGFAAVTKYHVVFIPKGRRKMLYGAASAPFGRGVLHSSTTEGKPDRGRTPDGRSCAHDDRHSSGNTPCPPKSSVTSRARAPSISRGFMASEGAISSGSTSGPGATSSDGRSRRGGDPSLHQEAEQEDQRLEQLNLWR